MNHLLAPAHRPILEQCAGSRVFLGFDFDGTLAPIVPEPDAACLRPRTRELLIAVASRYPTAVISGRSRDDVRAKLEGVPLVEVVGNHGLEHGGDEGRFSPLIQAWNAALNERLRAVQGVVIEDKGRSLSLHYRNAMARRDARRAIDAAVSALGEGVRVMDGKLCVSVLPEGTPHKGTALRRLWTQQGADTALYVGDDVTDEDVFTLDEPGRLLSIRVGRKASSAASYYLRDQGEINDLLEALLDLRADAPLIQCTTNLPEGGRS